MVVLFDGVCNLCNKMVQFILKRDKKNLFQFASLQSAYGIDLLKHYNLSTTSLDTFLLFDGEKIYNRSTAVLMVLRELGGIYKVLSYSKAVPVFIRDFIYNSIANYRYKLFGKREECMVPNQNVKDKFLDNTQFIPPKTQV